MLTRSFNLGPVPFDVFLKMWRAVEEDDGWNTEQYEESFSFRKANNETDPSDTKRQAKAQYGRLMFQATKALFEQVMDLKYYHRFLDIGHGVGNTVLQAAYTVACESLGIELVGIRHERAMVYEEKMKEVDELHNKQRDGKHYTVGPVRMRHGSLEAQEHRSFLTQDVDFAFCNNFGQVFGDRSKKGKELHSMDDHLAGLFCLLKPGAVLVTLYPLILGFSRDEANAVRSLHGLPESDEASFYTEEEYELSGKGLLSWTNNNFKAYKYTRLPNSTFLCCNSRCKKAQDSTPIPSYKTVDDLVLLNRCDCLVERKTRRSGKYQIPHFDIKVEDDDYEEED